jgi:outer membrane immunogenic protein
MKKQLLSSVALAALMVTPALAADLPRKAPAYVPPAPPPFSWTGFYVGASAGFIANDSEGNDNGDGTGDGWINTPATYRLGQVGGLFGVDVGYNWQFSPNWVLGIEADIAGATGNGDGFSDIYGSEVYSKLSALGTIRGRIGYAFDRMLVYATGGFAYGKVHDRVSWEQAPDYTADESKWKTGWTLGGGLEYAFPNNWTVRAEGLYVDLGSTSFTNISSCNFGFKHRYALGRIGINYKF